MLAAAESPTHVLTLLAGSVLIGASVAALLRTISATLETDDAVQDRDWRYDVNRINELRRIDAFYRGFYPLIQLLARFNRGAWPDLLQTMHREIQAAGLPRYWTAAEYLARLQVMALLMLPVYAVVCVRLMGVPGLVLALVLTLMTAVVLRRNLAERARYRLLLIKRRLPYLLDLLTLLMEAGATFLQALRQAADEYARHPVGQEFGRVLSEMSMGKSRTASLEALRDRLNDDEITSLVGSIIQGETLGTPLARLFRTQADVLRIKRVQRAETVAGEAGVKMLLPAVLIMAATVIVILGPFILNLMFGELI